MSPLIRFDDGEEVPVQDIGAEGFGVASPLAPPRPDTTRTALVTGMALAVGIALTATALSLGRAQSEHATAAPNVVAAQPLHPGVAKI